MGCRRWLSQPGYELLVGIVNGNLKQWSRLTLTLYLRLEGSSGHRPLGDAHVDVRLSLEQQGDHRAATASLAGTSFASPSRISMPDRSRSTRSPSRRTTLPTRPGNADETSGATADTDAPSSPATSAPGASSASCPPRSAPARPRGRSTARITRPRRDEERARPLPDDGDGALRHDLDDERVREGAVERRRATAGSASSAASPPRGRPAAGFAHVLRERAPHLGGDAGRGSAHLDRPDREDRRLARAEPGEERAAEDRERGSTERPDGTSHAGIWAIAGFRRDSGTTTLSARERGRDPEATRPRGHGAVFAVGGTSYPRCRCLRWARRRGSSGPRRRAGQAHVAEQHDLGLELDAELLARAPARLAHQREAVGRRRPAGVLDEVRVLRRDDRATDPVPLQPAELEHLPRRRDRPPGS